MEETAEETSKSEIAHVLMLDVVGYSKLLIDQQTKLMATLNEIVRNTARFQISDVGGKLICISTGDGMALVFFTDPQAPMECAVQVAAALKNHPEISVRMGIHSGPVNRVVDVNRQTNVTGAGVDLAQRVMDCGDAGHILLSRRIAYDLAPMTRWNASLYELGDYEAKHGQKISVVNFYTDEIGNRQMPMKMKRAQKEAARKAWVKAMRMPVIASLAVIVLAAAMTRIYVRERRLTAPLPVSPPEESIAVLPFVDLSQAHDQEYFCDGISEEILGALAKVDGLRVVARTSSFSFKGKNVEASEIARKLNVSTLLEGSLRRDGNRIRVNARLVNARSGFEIWSNKIDTEMTGVFAMQDEITRAIVDALKVKLVVAPLSRPQQNTEAYDLYLQGLFFSNKSDEESLRKSLGLFEQALKLDPNLGRAWTGIAKDWSWLADAYVRPLDAHPRSQAAASKALAIDEHDPEAHVYLGETKRILAYDLKGEELELNRALALDPNSAAAHLFMALWDTSVGKSEEGIKQMQTAIRLDPLSPIIGTMSVNIYVANDRLDEALAAAKRTMEIDPNYVYFEPNLAFVYREQGKLSEALAIYQRLQQTRHRPTAGLAITYARLGRTEEARRVLGELIRIANTGYVPGETIASVYVALGDSDEAFRWLDRAVKEHSGAIHGIAFEREFRPLRGNLRFADILRRIGLDRKAP